MSDIFREVDEDLRHEQLMKLWRRLGPYIVAGAVGIVAVTGAYVAWERWHTARQTADTTALMAATAQVEPVIANGAAPAPVLKGLEGAVASLHGTPATLARLQEAAVKVASGDRDGAIALYDQVAGDSANDALFRELAVVLSVTQQADSGDIAKLQARLAPLLGKSPWRFSAMELSALLDTRAGDGAKAREKFQQIASDPQAPAGIRSRAADLAALYAEQK